MNLLLLLLLLRRRRRRGWRQWGHGILAVLGMGTVASLRQHEQAVRSVVIVRIKGAGGCFRFSLVGGIAVGEFLWLARDSLGLTLLVALSSSSVHGSPVEINCARRDAAALKLGKQGLRVRACGREHRPAAARREPRTH